ncbi:SurA N-terminal domain-containing protein [Novosphingobium pentaromativorans]|uniref:Parvulin-like PPIase n=1 Tax=Novosphingobium pentaromativorans US6-1 TaxID=1088721 RepID=G6EIQ4_9SPHN|nr:SurA N-terminal domain-containing protein [Novosphingobium pentaromativorans]AIT78870.1 peptidylprolyl isomerase [Novosphingobium pentaromativorans US6-1]EHJ58996.1 peptidyl-prolyl cis-trans isomerase D [Novosphingobium pentaromativorans US6-1]
MLTFFRSMLKSKIGAAVALIMLVVIALAFASGDIAGLSSSAGLGGGTKVATVGKESIDAPQLTQSARAALERVKRNQPTATMKLMVAEGGVEQVLDDLIDRTALFVFGKQQGVVAGDRLIDSEITQIPGFMGVDGKFSQDTFRQALAQQGLTEKVLREDIAQGLVSQQLLVPAQYGAVMSKDAARRYASLLGESRTGTIAAFPSSAFMPEKDPTDIEIQAFYKDHINEFIRPERRVIRYATFGEDAIKAPAAPTDKEIAARYDANKAQYAAQDKRRITQLIVPTEAAAKAIVAEVNGGKSLEAAAKEKGLSAARLEFFSKTDLSEQFSPAVADAVFAADTGKLAVPQKSPLGWHVIRVEEKQEKPARTLAEVKDELAKQIEQEKRRAAFTDELASLEDKFADGANLIEVAKSLGIEVQTTAPITADGQVYLKPGEKAPDVIAPVLKTAFSMEEEQPQVAEVERGKTFMIYDVSEIDASAPAPLKEIKDDVKVAWSMDKGSQAAKAAALKVQAEVKKGTALEKAMASVGKRLPPIQPVTMSRPTLTAAIQNGRQVPAPISLMFHMAENTVKVQAAPQERGWFVVALKKIDPAKIDSDDLVANTQKELGQQLGQAYADALGKAIRKDVGVTKNAAAIKAVRDELAGTGSAQ